MAATDSKPSLAALKTPHSATYPSELRSPMVLSATSAMTPTFAAVKKEDLLKTPITPPTAYLDFLKTLSPVLTSPVSTAASAKPGVDAKRPASMASLPSSLSTAPSSSASASPPADVTVKADMTHKTDKMDKPAASAPPTSSASGCGCNCAHAKPEPPKTAPLAKDHLVTIPSPSLYARSRSAPTPRLYIPQSPRSSATVLAPVSAKSTSPPYSAVSPKTWELDSKITGRTRRVSVREVVTRTVTYSSTPVDTKAPSLPPPQIDPAPRGKRRKVE